MSLSLWPNEKGSLFWKANGMMSQGSVLALAGRASDAIRNVYLRDYRLAVNWRNSYGCHFICRIWRAAYAELGQFDDAWRCLGEALTAIETTKERWCEAEVNRIAGEIALNVA